MAALAAQILPSDDGPGADEAGVIYFIDGALTTFDADQRGVYRSGMTEIQGIAARSKATSFNGPLHREIGVFCRSFGRILCLVTWEAQLRG